MAELYMIDRVSDLRIPAVGHVELDEVTRGLQCSYHLAEVDTHCGPRKITHQDGGVVRDRPCK